MDRLDFRILKILLVNNGVPPGTPVLRKSFRSIARDLGVDQGTIRSRLKKFQEQRVLKGWYLGISPALTGDDVVQGWLTVSPESNKSEVIARLLSIPKVERVCNYLGPRLSFGLYFERGTDPEEAMRVLSERAGSGVLLYRHQVVRMPARSLKETDSSILGSLQEDPWAPYPAVAERLGLSAKTVSRRIARLSEDGAIYLLPIIDLKALQGFLPVELVVQYSSSDSRASANHQIVSRIKEEIVFSDGYHGYFALGVSNVSHMEQVVAWVKQIEGVKEVRADALQDVILNRTHYERIHLPAQEDLAAGQERIAGVP